MFSIFPVKYPNKCTLMVSRFSIVNGSDIFNLGI